MNTQPRHPKCRALPVEPHPDIHFSAMIPRRTVKIKFFLSVVIHVVKAAFVPFSATGGKPAIARAARHSGLLSKPRMDRVYALPNQARYQLRYTRIFSFFHYTTAKKKTKIILSVPVSMVKAVFAPLSAASRNPANTVTARPSGVSSYPVPDTAMALSSAALSQSVCP